MPIRIDALPVPDPHGVKLPQSVTISLQLPSSGNANTMAFIRYSIDPSNDVCFAGGAKVVTAPRFVVPVPPGVVNDDTLSLMRCVSAGMAPVNLPIALEVQECDASGAPISIPDHRNVIVQVL